MMTEYAEEATYAISEIDLRRAARLQLLSSFHEERYLFGQAFTLTLLLAPAAAFYLVIDRSAEALDGIVTYCFLVTTTYVSVLFLYPLLIGPFVIRRRFRRNSAISRPVKIMWDDEAIETAQGGVVARIPWTEFLKSRENKHLFALFVSRDSFQILPKRSLTDAQIRDIRRVVTAVNFRS